MEPKKKKKLKLEDLKAESFVTNLDEQGAETVKGGASPAVSLLASMSVAVSLTVAVSVLNTPGGGKLCNTGAYCTNNGANGCSAGACI